MRADNFSDSPENAGLRIGCGFPAAMADFRSGKKGTRRRFKLFRRQKPRGAAVILAKTWVVFDREFSGRGENFGSFAGLLFVAAPDITNLSNDLIGCKSGCAVAACRTQTPVCDRDMRIDCDLRMCDDQKFRHLVRQKHRSFLGKTHHDFGAGLKRRVHFIMNRENLTESAGESIFHPDADIGRLGHCGWDAVF